jgi:tetratricopeptide (TPR) repeat protein
MNKLPDKKSSKSLPAPSKINHVIPLLIILAATFIIFLPALGHGLILWDDHSYTYENPFLKNFNFREVFSFSTFYMGNYHPLTLLWLHLDWLIFPHGDPGTYAGVNAFWFHLNNIVLHLLNVILVFYLIYELLDRKGLKTAAVTAALFAIHPMHVESVVWVSELKDVLYGVFFLSSALVYVRYVKTCKPLLLVVSFVLFIFSNLAKAQAVTLPVLFLLFDYYKGRKINFRVIFEKVPFFILCIFFGILAVKAQIVITALNKQHVISLTSALNACYGLMNYLVKLIVPVHLSAVHPYSYQDLSSFPWYFYIFPVILAGLIFLAFRSARRTKDYLFGFLFYLITVSVMIKFLPVGDSLINERYTYIPYIGLFFIAGQLYSRISGIQTWRYLAVAVMAGILVIFSLMTIQRTRIWKDNLTFWNDVISKYPDYWRGYFGVGLQFYNAGDYNTALEYTNLSCEKAAPAIPYMLRGTIYFMNLKNDSLAIADFKKVISLHEPSNPFDLDVRYNLGLAYENTGNYPEAITILDESIRMAPDKPRGYVLKGDVLVNIKQFANAETEYTKAIRVSADYIDAYLKRGLLYEDKLNHFDQAIADFRKALAIEPGRKDATVNIAISLYKKHSFDEAIQQCNLALQLFGDDAQVYYVRALSNREKGLFNEAYNDGLKSRQLGYRLSDKDLEILKSTVHQVR